MKAITIAVLAAAGLLIAGCDTPLSNAGFTVTMKIGPTKRGGFWVACANTHTHFFVDAANRATFDNLVIGDVCPPGERHD